jgi:AraC-like DNA-binding protein
MTTSATALRLFVEALDELDVDGQALLADCEIEAATLQDPEAQLPDEHFERVWVAALERTGDPCIGLHAGEQIRAHAVNLFGYLMLSSSTLEAGLRRVARYQPVITGVPWIRFEDDSDSTRLRVGAAAGSDEFRAVHAEYVAALIPRMMDWVSEVEIRPVGASFRHEARGPVAEYERVLRCRVRFGAEQNEIRFNAATLSYRSRHAEESVARMHEEFAERLLENRSETELTPRVRRLLAGCLESRETSLATVARQLGMGARSLQRQLSNEGGSFSALLDGLRCDVAREYLARRQIPISGVAHLAGFSDVSAFTRATNRWFGAPPARVREQAQHQSPSSG